MLCLAEVLPRHTLTASLVWPCLVKLLSGLSLKAAVEKLRLPFALETLYRLRAQMEPAVWTTASHPALPSSKSHRSAGRLIRCCKPWNISTAVFPREECPPAAFQLGFQVPFLG